MSHELNGSLEEEMNGWMDGGMDKQINIKQINEWVDE